MKTKTFVLLAVMSGLFSSGVHAHKRWLLPTDFSLSDAETVTVDFTASNNIFYVDKGMPLTGVQALSPTGKTVSIDNPTQGKRRSSFDVDIAAQGTYRVFVQGTPVYFLSYELPGVEKLHYERGPQEHLKTVVPPGAENVQFAQSTALIESYITLGAPSVPVPLATAKGITLRPVSHPSELYADEPAEFVLLLNGEPALGQALTVIPEGTRYRDSQSEGEFSADDKGLVRVEWQGPGRYLLEAAVEVPGDGAEFAVYYYNYFLTVEVLAP